MLMGAEFWGVMRLFSLALKKKKDFLVRINVKKIKPKEWNKVL